MSAGKPRVYNKRSGNYPKEAVLVDRTTKWGNPFHIGQYETRAEVIEKYRRYISVSKQLQRDLPELRGKDLVCWCHPLSCHADVLLELANKPM